MTLIAIIVLHWVPFSKAQYSQTPDNSTIGDINFQVSCENVSEDFNRALGMLHHMMYAAARDAFEKMVKKDPDCAMAHWGIATTLFQPLWGTRPDKADLQRGWQEIQKAREQVESDRERVLIESTAAFFQEPETADFRTRIERWVEGVKTAYKAYPNDVDIAAFYGLSLLTTAQWAENRGPLHDEAEKVLRDIFERVPGHPGAIHYSIHATDVTGRAKNALDMVEAYSKIAPEVPHALHMPSHIYVRLGDWQKTIDWNIKSAEAALNFPINGAESHHYLHALDYLIYAYLQRGEDDKAKEAMKKAMQKDKYQRSLVSAYHLAVIPARLAVEQREWQRASALEPRTPGYLPWEKFPWAEGLTWHAKGLGAVNTGDIKTAQKALERLEELQQNAKNSGQSDMATYIDINRRVLAGKIEYARGYENNAVQLMRSAAELEQTVEKHPVTPGALLPPYEALGDLLMDLERYDKALEAYKASDEIWPGRYKTLLGAARAAKAAGQEQTADEYYNTLISTAGDSKRPTLIKARQYITQR